VAHWAHVYGFGFGVLVAGAVRLLNLERILVRRSGGDAEHAVLRMVDDFLSRNRYQEAWTQLTHHLYRVPNDRDAGVAYWNLAKRLGRCDAAAPILLRILQTELDLGHDADGLAHWADLRVHAPAVVPEVDLMMRVTAALAKGGADGEAETLAREALARVNPTTPVATLVELYRITATLGTELAVKAQTLVRAHPSFGLQFRSTFDSGGLRHTEGASDSPT
jgi:hypothetical protein